MKQEDARIALLKRRKELEEEGAANSVAREVVALDQESVGRLSRVDALQQQAMALAAEERREAYKARIAAAIERLDEGEWGYCLGCGEEIASKRLINDPSVPQCIACASKAG
jgi:DnaK suppressor protein